MNYLRLFGSSSGASTGDAPSEKEEDTSTEKLFGLQNFGNTCYANSVLQALYFCEPFRERVEELIEGDIPPSSPTSAASHASQHQQREEIRATNGTILSHRPSTAGSTRSASSHNRSVSAASASSSSAPPPHRRLHSSFGERGPTLTSLNINGSTGAVASNASTKNSPQAPQHALHGHATALSTDSHEDEQVATTLYATLRDLFGSISTNPGKTGVVAPKAFIQQLKRENELFRSTMHQDAHEFLNYLLNAVAEELEKQTRESRTQKPKTRNEAAERQLARRDYATWIHSLFEGVLTNETRCLTCETVTSRDESFLDLSIDIDENTSVTSCLRQFSASEMLCSKNKFSCDTCCGLQEAEKRMKIKHLPDILALHLKRFKWQEDVQRFAKLNYRVVFPFELRLFNTVDTSPDADRLYTLWAIVVHIGAGPHHGHYIALIKSNDRWLAFDDDQITQIDEATIAKYYGDTPGNGAGYVLFYQAADLQPQPKSHVEPVLDMSEAHNTENASSPSALAKLQTSGLGATRPANLYVDPALTPTGAPTPMSSASPVKERKSFFGLQSRKSLNSKTESGTMAAKRSSSIGRDSSPGNRRSIVDVQAQEHSPSFDSQATAVRPNGSSTQLTSAVPSDFSDTASFSTSSSGHFSSALAAQATAAGNLGPPSLPHSVTVPNIRQALTPSETSPQRPVLTERSTLGRLFGRTKSMRVMPSESSSTSAYELPDSGLSGANQSEQGEPITSLDKKQLKEQVKREKEMQKAAAKREKEEAKRLRQKT